MTRSSGSPEHNNGRLLLAEDSFDMPQQSKFSYFTYLLCLICRLFAILFIFLKLFVFGEPSLRPDSKIAAKYWAFRRQADFTLQKVYLKSKLSFSTERMQKRSLPKFALPFVYKRALNKRHDCFKWNYSSD